MRLKVDIIMECNQTVSKLNSFKDCKVLELKEEEKPSVAS